MFRRFSMELANVNISNFKHNAARLGKTDARGKRPILKHLREAHSVCFLAVMDAVKIYLFEAGAVRLFWSVLRERRPLKGTCLLYPRRSFFICSDFPRAPSVGLYGFTQAVLVSRNKWPRIGLGGAGRLSLAFCRFRIRRQNFRAAANFAHGMEWAEILLTKVITGIVFFCFGNLSTPPGHFAFQYI